MTVPRRPFRLVPRKPASAGRSCERFKPPPIASTPPCFSCTEKTDHIARTIQSLEALRASDPDVAAVLDDMIQRFLYDPDA